MWDPVCAAVRSILQPSLPPCEISDWPHWKNLQAEPLIGGRGCSGRAGKLSNLSKNPRLSVVRANFGGSGAKRKLEAESTRDVAHHFPFFVRVEFPAYLFVYLVCGAITDIKMDVTQANEVIKSI